MDSSSMSSSGSLRKRAPTRCFCFEKPVLVVSWTPDNPGRRFYGCPNYWVGCKCKFFQWRDDEMWKHGKVLIPEQRQRILTLEAAIVGYRKREKRLLICLGLSLVISGTEGVWWSDHRTKGVRWCSHSNLTNAAVLFFFYPWNRTWG